MKSPTLWLIVAGVLAFYLLTRKPNMTARQQQVVDAYNQRYGLLGNLSQAGENVIWQAVVPKKALYDDDTPGNAVLTVSIAPDGSQMPTVT